MALRVAQPLDHVDGHNYNVGIIEYKALLKRLLMQASREEYRENGPVQALLGAIDHVEHLSYRAGRDGGITVRDDGTRLESPSKARKRRILSGRLWHNGPTLVQYALCLAFRSTQPMFRINGALEIIERLLGCPYVDVQDLSPVRMGEINADKTDVVAWIRGAQFLLGVSGSADVRLRGRWLQLADGIELRLRGVVVSGGDG